MAFGADSEPQKKPDSYFPLLYNFPPFFTRQANATTYSRQRDIWQQFILDYCRHHKLWKLNIPDMLDTPLFHNESINRRLKLQDVMEIVNDMIKKKTLEWTEQSLSKKAGERTTVYVFWHSLEEWADIMYKSMEDTGRLSMVMTFYEITQSEGAKREEYFTMDPDTFRRVADILRRRGLVAVLESEDGIGLKFWPNWR